MFWVTWRSQSHSHVARFNVRHYQAWQLGYTKLVGQLESISVLLSPQAGNGPKTSTMKKSISQQRWQATATTVCSRFLTQDVAGCEKCGHGTVQSEPALLREAESNTWGLALVPLQSIILQKTIEMLSVCSNRLTQEGVWENCLRNPKWPLIYFFIFRFILHRFEKEKECSLNVIFDVPLHIFGLLPSMQTTSAYNYVWLTSVCFLSSNRPKIKVSTASLNKTPRLFKNTPDITPQLWSAVFHNRFLACVVLNKFVFPVTDNIEIVVWYVLLQRLLSKTAIRGVKKSQN